MSRLNPKNTKTNAKRLKKATKRPTLASLQAEIIELQFKTGTIDQSAVDATLRQRVERLTAQIEGLRNAEQLAQNAWDKEQARAKRIADLEANLRHERDMRGVIARRVATAEAEIRRSAVAEAKASIERSNRFAALEAQTKVNDGKLTRVTALATDIENLKEITGGLWRTADGRLIAIRQMSDNHLLNTKRLLEASRGTVPPDVGSKQKVLANIDREIERRRTDLMWAERKPNPPITAPIDLGPGKIFVGDEEVGTVTSLTITPAPKSPTGQRVAEAVAELRRVHGERRWPSHSRGSKMETAIATLESLLPEIV